MDDTDRTIVLVGGGRLARALARSLGNRVALVLSGRAGDEPPSRQFADIASVAGRPAGWEALRTARFGVLWITTADSAIGTVAHAIAELRDSWQGILAVHSSGATPAGVLAPLAERGARVLALHPNGSFDGHSAIAKGLLWSVAEYLPEGKLPAQQPGHTAESSALAVAAELLGDLAPALIALSDEHRALYHAAASVAANYAVTLFAAALDMYRRAGVPAELAVPAVRAFMVESAERTARVGPLAAITGPITRGDAHVVARQEAAVALGAPQWLAMVRALADATATMLAGDGGADPEDS